MVIIKKERFVSDKSVLYISDDNETFRENVFDTKYKNLGAAVDIGTTSIAIGLFDMETKKSIGNMTQTNCQTNYGCDVMMRIMHCVNGKEQLLHDILIEQIENILEKIISDNKINKLKSDIKSSDIIKKMCIAGNTTMCHIFLNKDVSGLKGAPFSTAYKGVVRTESKKIGFKKYDIPEIVILPNIHSHVGADAASVLCQEKLYREDVNELAIDIGTNAEIILNNSGKIFVASTAAGPAFEGKGIESGMRAKAGAINTVKISRVNGNIILGMLDDGTKSYPQGICGSGLIDTIAELMKAGLLTKNGYLLTKEEALKQNVNINLCERIYRGDKKRGNSFLLSAENDVVVTQNDIRNVQLAKGAIQAGVEILLEKSGISMSEIDCIKIAGVFGKFINKSSAMLFGLLPKYPEKLEFIGNAAGNGVAKALFDDNFVLDMEKLVEKVKHIELADENNFQSKFMNAMELKEWYYN